MRVTHRKDRLAVGNARWPCIRRLKARNRRGKPLGLEVTKVLKKGWSREVESSKRVRLFSSLQEWILHQPIFTHQLSSHPRTLICMRTPAIHMFKVTRRVSLSIISTGNKTRLKHSISTITINSAQVEEQVWVTMESNKKRLSQNLPKRHRVFWKKRLRRVLRRSSVKLTSLYSELKTPLNYRK